MEMIWRKRMDGDDVDFVLFHSLPKVFTYPRYLS